MCHTRVPPSRGQNQTMRTRSHHRRSSWARQPRTCKVCIDTVIDTRIGMRIDVLMDEQSVYRHADGRTGVCRHVCRHASRHVYRHAHRHVYSHAHRHANGQIEQENMQRCIPQPFGPCLQHDPMVAATSAGLYIYIYIYRPPPPPHKPPWPYGRCQQPTDIEFIVGLTALEHAAMTGLATTGSTAHDPAEPCAKVRMQHMRNGMPPVWQYATVCHEVPWCATV